MNYFNRQTVQTAWDIVGPSIRATMERGYQGGFIKRPHLAAIVTGTEILHPKPAGVTFKDHCLLGEAIGDPKDWKYDYERIALAKACASVRTGQATATLSPHYLQQGDTVYWGSVVREGIVVACSGVQPYFDEMFSGWIADTIKAVAKDKLAAYRADHPDEDFIGLQNRAGPDPAEHDQALDGGLPVQS